MTDSDKLVHRTSTHVLSNHDRTRDAEIRRGLEDNLRVDGTEHAFPFLISDLGSDGFRRISWRYRIKLTFGSSFRARSMAPAYPSAYITNVGAATYHLVLSLNDNAKCPCSAVLLNVPLETCWNDLEKKDRGKVTDRP